MGGRSRKRVKGEAEEEEELLRENGESWKCKRKWGIGGGGGG